VNIYNLGKIDSTTDIGGASRYGFNIIGVQGRPLVGFSVRYPRWGRSRP